MAQQNPVTSSVAYSLDVDRLIREEATEWFNANRKDLETSFRRVADRIRQDLEAENIRLREEIKRMKQILNVVRGQVTDEEERQAG